jgi:hypothetical protein
MNKLFSKLFMKHQFSKANALHLSLPQGRANNCPATYINGTKTASGQLLL